MASKRVNRFHQKPGEIAIFNAKSKITNLLVKTYNMQNGQIIRPSIHPIKCIMPENP